MDIQAKLDEWLEGNAAIQKYVTKLWYIPEGEDAPSDVTHKLRLSSDTSAERALTVGLVVKPEFATVLDGLLAMIATQPRR